ncbi:pseudouridine synthase pus4 [Marasmius sp. AFHP31]|nr:pseudouridine synthase pus4 [Marasmius sp. AFHP31]
MDLGIPLEADETGTEALDVIVEDYGERPTIELCEVQLRFDGVTMSLSTSPLQAISTAEKKLKDLHFIPQPPQDRTGLSLPVYLVASFFDFQDYMALPASEIVCYSLTRQAQNDAIPWTCKQESSRSFENHQLASLVPCRHFSGSRGIIAGLYLKSSAQSQSFSAREKVRDIIGSLRTLKVPELVDDPDWEEQEILKPREKVGQDIPVGAVSSPNHSLLCTMSASVWSTQTSLQSMPQPKSQTPPLSIRLALAILSERTPTDVINQLSHHSILSNVIGNTLYRAFVILSKREPKSMRSWLKHMGTSLEAYKLRAAKTHDEQEREEAAVRWEVAHDICSLVSCNTIFKECKDGDDYNLGEHVRLMPITKWADLIPEVVWELVGLCTWIVGCIERIMKECVLALELASSGKLSGSVNRPSLLHLLLPQALQNLIEAATNVKRIREFLGSLTAKQENSQIARDVLIDQVDCSGITLSELLPILGELSEAVKTTSEEESLRSIAFCRPTEDMQKRAHTLLLKILNPKVVDKSRLFIKAHDFVDGMSRMTIEPQKHRDRDVVTKTLLMRSSTFRCLRCSGLSSDKATPSSPKIIPFIERYWVKRCICGGFWSRNSATRS